LNISEKTHNYVTILNRQKNCTKL